MRKVALAALSGAMMVVGAGTPTMAIDRDDETHCIVTVLGQEPDGEFVTSEPVCYDTLAAAISVATGGAVDLAESATSSVLFDGSLDDELRDASVIGTHFDGSGGGGASISVQGGSCTGGHWNTPTVWDNRISSSWHGCHRLRHYDLPSAEGSVEATTGVGTTKNLSSMNNKAESVSYHSS